MELWTVTASAFWLGILTSISPCPLATNIAAVSFLGRTINPVSVFFAGLIYTAGRAVTYLLLGILLVSSLLSAPPISHLLQKYTPLLTGPVLVAVGMILLGMIPFGFKGSETGKTVQTRIEKMGIWGAGLLGILFALSFCPTSAALFFGALLPIALKEQSAFLLPAVYGIATGVPALLFAVLLAASAHKVALVYNRIVLFERWARRVTGVVFIIAGAYYCLTQITVLSYR